MCFRGSPPAPPRIAIRVSLTALCNEKRGHSRNSADDAGGPSVYSMYTVSGGFQKVLPPIFKDAEIDTIQTSFSFGSLTIPLPSYKGRVPELLARLRTDAGLSAWL